MAPGTHFGHPWSKVLRTSTSRFTEPFMFYFLHLLPARFVFKLKYAEYISVLCITKTWRISGTKPKDTNEMKEI